MNTDQQMSLFRAGQPDEEAIRLLRGYEDFALKFDPRGYPDDKVFRWEMLDQELNMRRF